jgi:hypothetical protein
MANDTIANVISEMSGIATERQLREQNKAKRDAQRAREEEEAAAARRNANAMLDVQNERDRAWYATHLGHLSAKQYRDFCQQEYGFDPGV